MRLNAQYVSMIRASLAAHGHLMRAQAVRHKREKTEPLANADAWAQHIAMRQMQQALEAGQARPMGPEAPAVEELVAAQGVLALEFAPASGVGAGQAQVPVPGGGTLAKVVAGAAVPLARRPARLQRCKSRRGRVRRLVGLGAGRGGRRLTGRRATWPRRSHTTPGFIPSACGRSGAMAGCRPIAASDCPTTSCERWSLAAVRHCWRWMTGAAATTDGGVGCRCTGVRFGDRCGLRRRKIFITEAGGKATARTGAGAHVSLSAACGARGVRNRVCLRLGDVRHGPLPPTPCHKGRGRGACAVGPSRALLVSHATVHDLAVQRMRRS
jgi:hypothetical protein